MDNLLKESVARHLCWQTLTINPKEINQEQSQFHSKMPMQTMAILILQEVQVFINFKS